MKLTIVSICLSLGALGLAGFATARTLTDDGEARTLYVPVAATAVPELGTPTPSPRDIRDEMCRDAWHVFKVLEQKCGEGVMAACESANSVAEGDLKDWCR